jgi:hypothetical protein
MSSRLFGAQSGLSIFSLLVSLLWAAPAVAQTSYFNGFSYSYETNYSGGANYTVTVTITGFDPSFWPDKLSADIPDTVNGLLVTSIG